MINMIQAVRLLGIADYEIVTISISHGYLTMPSFPVSDLRKYFDMKNTKVTRIYTHGSIYDCDINWEFIVDNDTFRKAKMLENKLLNIKRR